MLYCETRVGVGEVEDEEVEDQGEEEGDDQGEVQLEKHFQVSSIDLPKLICSPAHRGEQGSTKKSDVAG